MVGGFPRKEGMERKDVMSKNVSIYKAQASALEQHAAPNCKVNMPFSYLLYREKLLSIKSFIIFNIKLDFSLFFNKF